ncbi:MAG TPA: hypothetical protein VMF14_22125, partial [Solirubrobacteraceae bacterium]|nr:hypothetical protein [Solirubrobacteraceae bacterium]
MRNRILLAVIIVVAVGAVGAEVVSRTGSEPPASPAAGRASCNLYASPSGSASGDGSLSHPVATVQELDWALAPGQTGCLLSGTYGSI